MDEEELNARSEAIYDLSDQIIGELRSIDKLETEIAVAAVSASYANIVWNTGVSMHDAIDLFVTFYKQMVQKGAAH